MVNNIDVVGIFTWVTPGLASLVVLITAWRTSAVRSTGWREAPTALVATIGAALGVAAYLTPAAGVEPSSVLVGATIALLATALRVRAHRVPRRCRPHAMPAECARMSCLTRR